MSQQLLEVPFRNDVLLVAEHNHQPYVPMKPVVEGMGLAWQSQLTKFRSNKSRWGVTVIVIPSEGGDQSASCLPLRKLPGWLMSIHPSRIKPELREKIVAYQNECDDILWEAWNKAHPIEQLTLSKEIFPAQQHALQQLVANKSGDCGKLRSYVWSRFNNHFKLGSYKQLPPEKFVEAVGYLVDIPMKGNEELSPKKYNYPRRLLEQSGFFVKGGRARLNISMLANKNFVSPLMHLLNDLRTDGHDVEAAWGEAIAMRDGIIEADEVLMKISIDALEANHKTASSALDR